MDLSGLQLRAAPASHLPVLRAIIDDLDIVGVVDTLLPKHPGARVSDAQCVVALILNILSGRLALWRMASWLEEIDLELVLGEGVEADAFNDTRLGEALEHIDAVGTDTVLSRVVLPVVGRPEHPRSYCVHLDTTSVSVYGRYLTVTGPPVPTHGFSKDKRPDLKQLIFGLSVLGGSAMPLTMSVSSGNTSEQTSNRDHLQRIATLLPKEHEVTIVADCKIVDAVTIGQLLQQGLHIVSLVPETFNVRTELVGTAISEHPDVQQWPLLASKPGRKKADPSTSYRGLSYERELAVLYDDGGEKVKAKVPMRFLVVHSEQLQNRFESSLADKMRREIVSVQEGRARAHKKGFACETDARRAAEQLVSSLQLYKAEIEVSSEERLLKRARRGRPRNGEEAAVEVVWGFSIRPVPDESAIERLRRESSCFVLVTDWKGEQWSDERVLLEYRSQSQVEGITGFRWLKDVAEVAPLFLEKPERIRALGLVLVLSLMVSNYLQYQLRSRMKARGQGVLHRFSHKIDDNLTTEMALAWFSGVQSIFVTTPDGQKTRAPPHLLPQALELLELLGLSPDIYTRPPT